MKTVHSSDSINVPAGVKIDIKSRVVTVTGPRGTLKKSFKHLQCEIKSQGKKKNKRVTVEVWFGTQREIATIKTVISHIKNMITGVTKGFERRMRYVYAHFPINTAIAEDGGDIEIRNFLGEKMVRKVVMLPGVKVSRSKDQKDEIILQGNDLELVSQSAANIQGTTKVRNKDIRKFLDGVYVSERNVLGER